MFGFRSMLWMEKLVYYSMYSIIEFGWSKDKVIVTFRDQMLEVKLIGILEDQ